MIQNISFIPASETVVTKIYDRNISNITSPVVFMCNGIGDGLLALPTIRALAQLFSNKLTIIYDAVVTPYWLYDLPLKKIILIEVDRNKNEIQFDYESVAHEIDCCDLFVSFSYKSPRCLQPLLELINPCKTIGFDRSFDVYIEQYNRQHASDAYFKAIKVLEPMSKITEFNYPMSNLTTVTASTQKIIDSLKSMLQFDSIIGIHTDTQPEKMWQPNCWVETIEQLLHDNPESAIFAFGSNLTFETNNPRVLDFTRVPFEHSVALISHCHYFIGVDSCLLHVADLQNVPGIGLFLDTDPRIWGYRFADKHFNMKDTPSKKITPAKLLDHFSAIQGEINAH